MAVGSSDGVAYESEMHEALGKPIDTSSTASTMPARGPEKPADAFKSDPGTKVAQGIDRTRFQAELDKNPNLIPKMASMVKGEVGFGKTPLEHQQVQLETAFNRAQARGHSLSQALLSIDEDPRRGYYAGGRQGTYSRPASAKEIEAFRKNVLDPVMKGSNLSDRGFGPMTGNASAQVAAHQFAKGTPGYKLGQESYFNEERGRHLAALKSLPRLGGEAPISGHASYASEDNIHVDRTKDVPLAASALHKNGEMYGIAIDRDAPHKPEYDKYIYKHESDEFGYMKDLMQNGMTATEAYRKAHDHITPMESARVQADLGEKGIEDYKQYWRDVASVSSKKEDPDRHPDAHTTTHGLDEAELGRSFGKEAMFRGLKGAGITMTDAGFDQHLEDTGKMHPEDVLNPMSTVGTMAGPGPQPWFRGADSKRRQEIPDAGAKIKPGIDRELQLPFSKRVERPILKLEDVIHHPELFKSYPELKDINVVSLHPQYTSQGVKGGMSTDGKSIHLSPYLSYSEIKSVLLHEIQHIIQHQEGFTQGASIPRMRTYIDQALKNTGIPAKGMQDAAAFQAYENVAGEVESRNVQRRMDWPPEALHIFPPNLTEDVPRNKQLNAPK